jgi:hypothetical protein
MVGIIILLAPNCVYSQESSCYTQLYDGSGYPLGSHYAQLNTAACALKSALPVEYQASFQVYDFGFYRHNESMVEGLKAIFGNALNKIINRPEYYLIFGRQLNNEGGYTRIWVKMNLPREGKLSCLTDQQYSDIGHLLEASSNYEGVLKELSGFVTAEIETMQLLQKAISEISNCCDASSLRSTCSITYGNRNYMLVNGVRYENGATVYIYAGDVVKMEPFRGNNQAFTIANTTWTGKVSYNDVAVNSEVGHIDVGWHYYSVAPSPTIGGTSIKATQSRQENNKTVQDEVFVRVVEFSILYCEPGQTCSGMDENDPKKEDDYSSYQTTPVIGLPWKVVIADGKQQEISFVSKPVGISQQINFLISNSNDFSFNNALRTISTTSIGETDLIPRIGNVNFDRGILKLVSYPFSTQSVYLPVFSIKETNGLPLNFSEAGLTQEFNRIFGIIGIKFAFDIREFTLNFDLNNDRKVDNTEGSAELKVISDFVAQKSELINNPTGVWMVVVGMTATNERLGEAQYSTSRAYVYDDYYQTATHEIGHLFKLKHPWEDFENYPKREEDKPEAWIEKDIHNFMEWKGPLFDKSRKYQWDIIWNNN